MTAATPTLRRARQRLPGGPELEYVEQGPRGGPTLLLLHGITDSWRSFEPVLPHLPSHWHVLALTQRGHGGSDKPAGGYGTRDFAADAATFAQALGLPPLVVVGHSMGAANAMRLVIDHPGLVRGLVAAGAFAGFGDKAELVDFVHGSIEPLTDPIPRGLAQAFQQDTLARPVLPQLLSTAVDESLRAPAFVWRAAFAGLLEDDFVGELPRIAVPTLLVQGSADVFVPAADTERLLQLLPQARASVWAGAGHAMHWEEPAHFADELRRFVQGLLA
jgi:non-heme chloroperoxidase